jgi:hypothetical protein
MKRLHKTIALSFVLFFISSVTENVYSYWDKYCGKYCSVVGPLQYEMEFNSDNPPQMTFSQARNAIVQTMKKMNDGLSNIKVTTKGIYASRRNSTRPSGFFPFNDYNYLIIRLQQTRKVYYLDHGSWVTGGPFGSFAGGEWNDIQDGKRFIEAFAALRYYERHPSAVYEESAKEFAKFSVLAKAWREMAVKPPLPEDVQRSRIMAEDAFNNKDFGKAAEYYEKGLEVEPLWPQGQFNAAILRGELQDYLMAAFHMKCYLELVPDAPNAKAAREKIYLWEGKAKEDTTQ